MENAATGREFKFRYERRWSKRIWKNVLPELTIEIRNLLDTLRVKMMMESMVQLYICTLSTVQDSLQAWIGKLIHKIHLTILYLTYLEHV